MKKILSLVLLLCMIITFSVPTEVLAAPGDITEINWLTNVSAGSVWVYTDTSGDRDRSYYNPGSTTYTLAIPEGYKIMGVSYSGVTRDSNGYGYLRLNVNDSLLSSSLSNFNKDYADTDIIFSVKLTLGAQHENNSWRTGYCAVSSVKIKLKEMASGGGGGSVDLTPVIQKIDMLTLDNNTIKTTLNQTTTSLTTLNTLFNSMDSRVGNLSATTATIDTKVNTLDTRTTSMQTAITTLNTKSDSMQTTITNVNNKSDVLQTSVNNAHTKIDNLSTKMDNLKNDISNQVITIKSELKAISDIKSTNKMTSSVEERLDLLAQMDADLATSYKVYLHHKDGHAPYLVRTGTPSSGLNDITILKSQLPNGWDFKDLKLVNIVVSGTDAEGNPKDLGNAFIIRADFYFELTSLD